MLAMLCLCLAFWSRHSNIHLVFSAFTSRPASLLASIRVSVFLFMVSMLSPSRFILYYQHRSAADMSHLNSVPVGYPNLS
jgi:hypothetical protein